MSGGRMNWRDNGRDRPGAKLPGQRFRASADARIAEIVRAAKRRRGRPRPAPVGMTHEEALRRLLARGQKED